MESVFAHLAGDPNLVPGIYNYCDQWCTYCGMTSHCLAFLATTEWETKHHASPAATVQDAVSFTREVARAEGTLTQAADAGLQVDQSGGQQPDPEDPAEAVAMEYAMLSELFLRANRWKPPIPRPDRLRHQPTPLDVVAWYHVVIAAKLHRALEAAGAAAGKSSRSTDAAASAKVALIGIDRSRRALQTLGRERPRAGTGPLISLLDELGRLVESRFPDARAFVRPGLDARSAQGPHPRVGRD